ncbi:MAG: hypothetical protein GXY75_05275 [Bacteroidales bacterium]|jgi:hypothetical protein|nr:hypothetical protein [Bacteroidales bacterium]
MKRMHLFLISALMLLSFSGCEKEELQDLSSGPGATKYYLVGDNEKIFLYEIVGKFVVQLDTTQVFKTILRKLMENPEIEYINTFDEEDYLVIVKSKLSLRKIKRQPTIINAMPAYSMDGVMPTYLNGDLLLGLKKGCSIDDVRHVFKRKAVVKSEGGYDNYTLQVKDWEKIFDLSNTLHNHEKVSYCQPDMTANFVPF